MLSEHEDDQNLIMPVRLRKRPTFKGIPVPYFVAWFKDGQQAMESAPGAVPDFRITSELASLRCRMGAFCWICGEPLGSVKAFVFGPLSALHGVSAEPPSHRDCARYAVRTCPYMLNQSHLPREGNLPADRNLVTDHAMKLDNPGMFLVWNTKTWRHHWNDPHGKLILCGEPTSVEWYIAGKRVPHEQASIKLSEAIADELALARTRPHLMVDRAYETYARELSRKEIKLRKMLPDARQ